MRAGKLPKVDVGILTMRDDEFQAVIGRFPVSEVVKGRRIYNLSALTTLDGDYYDVAVLPVADRTSREAEGAARDILSDLRPDWILLVGVGAAVPSATFTLGDVGVSSSIDGMKIGTFKTEAYSIQPEAADVVANLSAFLSRMNGWNTVPWSGSAAQLNAFADAAELYGPPQWRDSLMHEFLAGDIETRPPKASARRVLATDELIDYLELLPTLSRYKRPIAVVELASAAIHRVATEQRIPCLSIRSMSHVLGLKGRDPWVRYACDVAASFTHAFLRAAPIKSSHRSAAPRALAVGDDEPFRIDKIALTQVRGFADIEITAGEPDKSRKGAWIVLLGDNGVGKTTVLRALALALSPPETGQAALSRLDLAAGMVRAGHSRATIEVHSGGGLLPIVTIASGNSRERLDFQASQRRRFRFVVGYGCRRGSALGGAARDARPTPLGTIETLFDESANLIHAETWLRAWKLAEAEAPEGSADARFFHAIISVLCKLLDLQSITVTRDRVEVHGRSVGKVPLSALSDGYLTTAGWVLDMVAHWIEEARREELAIDDTFNERMTGVALVDEIDLHLHPRWQREILKTIRELFPNMSFVVTTHNPLTLLGAQPGEIQILRRDEKDGVVGAEQHDLPPGATAEQVLTGDWFGLASTLDDATLDLLEKHRELLRRPGPGTPEVLKLEEKLRARLGSFADSSVERLAHAAAAKVIDEDLRTLTLEKREEAAREIEKMLREPSPGARPKKRRRPKQG
jgi:nucleoside phosphorylase/energy-coupling factor transporter ATP-binding protein EcfA2